MVSMRTFWVSPLSLLSISSSLLYFKAVAISIPLHPTILTSLNAGSFADLSTNLTNLGAIDPKKPIRPGHVENYRHMIKHDSREAGLVSDKTGTSC